MNELEKKINELREQTESLTNALKEWNDEFNARVEKIIARLQN